MNEDTDIPSSPLCRVVCAACRKKQTGMIVAGVRHKDIFMQPLMGLLSGWEEGFLTNTFEFVDRAQAWKIAEAAGQIRNPQPGQDDAKLLFSEHLY